MVISKLLPIVCLALAACNPIQNPEHTAGSPANSEFLTEILGCRVYKITYETSPQHSTSEFRMAICKDQSTTAGIKENCGKNCTRDILTVAQKTEEELKAEAEARIKRNGLAKLTDEEKRLLGIK